MTTSTIATLALLEKSIGAAHLTVKIVLQESIGRPAFNHKLPAARAPVVSFKLMLRLNLIALIVQQECTVTNPHKAYVLFVQLDFTFLPTS